MKRILVSLLTPVLVIGVVGSGALAWFSDTETSTDNNFTTGTLDLGLANSEPGQELPTGSVTATFTAEKWAPGQKEDGTLYISNAGSIGMKTLRITFTYTLDTSQRPSTIDLNDPLEDSDDFDKMIKISKATWKDTEIGSIVGKNLAELNGDVILLSNLGGLGNPDYGLNAGETGELYLEFTFDCEATNGCQGNNLELTITVTGIQRSKLPPVSP